MKKTDFIALIEICLGYHTTNITINHVKPNAQVELTNRVLIHDACAGLIDELIAKGYKLDVSPEGVNVHKYL